MTRASSRASSRYGEPIVPPGGVRSGEPTDRDGQHAHSRSYSHSKRVFHPASSDDISMRDARTPRRE